MNETQKRALTKATEGEIRFDNLTRQLYATDASIYQIIPAAVAFPRTAKQAGEVIRAAVEAGIPVTPRGAGTGLAGGAVGAGLIVDFARYHRRISDFNRAAHTVRVGAGVVLDQLNGFLQPHGLWFGPDVATSSRATLGGMIASNSSGARARVYGMTADHVLSLEIVLADGTVTTVGRGLDTLPEHRRVMDRLIERYAEQIRARLPAGRLNKRWPGYGFDYYLREPGDLAKIIAGSEGTLAGLVSAELNLVPLPANRKIGVVFFAAVPQAMEAAVELLDLHPAAIEHIDRPLFDQTRGKLAFAAARALMQLDEQPCEAILIVEFFDADAESKLQEVVRRKLGLRTLIPADEGQQQLIWAVRKQGLNLLTACPGAAKPTPGLEDVAVPPKRIAEYVSSLRNIFAPRGIQTSYYGHVASGLLHVRPKLDLHTAADIAKYRELAEEVSALCRQFQGSLAGEHGVGIARTEFLAEHLGAELAAAIAEVKQLFDPRHLMNPGKIVPDAKNYRIDTNLRYGAGYRIELPFEPLLQYVERDGSFVGNLEQCNGCGECRKDPPTMCPTFAATGEEIMVTRGRANTIRAALDGRLGDDALASPDLEQALAYCLSCKACKSECPSNVDLTLLKADLLHARQQRDGIPLVDRAIAHADLLGRLGTAFNPLSNWVLRRRLTAWLMYKLLGFTPQRPMPPYAARRFDRWFAKHVRGLGRRGGPRGRVILWDDTWVRYHEPNVGQAAVKVLEAAGFEVLLPRGRKCCGRPACSRGVLNEVLRLGRHNVQLFLEQGGREPIIFLEPSCYSMFVDEYRQMRIPGAEQVAGRCVLFEQFIYDLLRGEPRALPFKAGALRVAIHGHCHSKALTDAGIMPALAKYIPQAAVQMLKSGCCGMAGAFGMMADKYELSKQVAQPLIEQINALPPGTRLVASGTSCRHQITHLSSARPLHMAELLAEAL